MRVGCGTVFTGGARLDFADCDHTPSVSVRLDVGDNDVVDAESR